MKDIKYIRGDATRPDTSEPVIIAHICNDIGAWGKGFVIALSRRWKTPETEYRKWSRGGHGFKLGNVQFVECEPNIVVCNMVAQKNIRTVGGVKPIRYGSLKKCLQKVAPKAIADHASIHMPRIGCGLAGGCWEAIEPILNETLCEKNIDVIVYDL